MLTVGFVKADVLELKQVLNLNVIVFTQSQGLFHT